MHLSSWKGQSGFLFSERLLAFPPCWGLLLHASLCTDHMRGTCYITPGWLKIHLAPAKFTGDGPGHCVVTCRLGAWTWQPDPDTAARTSHTYSLRPFISFACCAARRRETDLYTKPLTLRQSKFYMMFAPWWKLRFYFTYLKFLLSFASVWATVTGWYYW